MSFLCTCAGVLFDRIKASNKDENRKLIDFWCEIMDANGYSAIDICAGLRYIIDSLLTFAQSAECIKELLQEKMFDLQAENLSNDIKELSYV